jgi:hypothetical protein
VRSAIVVRCFSCSLFLWGHFFHRFQTAPRRPIAPVVEESAARATLSQRTVRGPLYSGRFAAGATSPR